MNKRLAIFAGIGTIGGLSAAFLLPEFHLLKFKPLSGDIKTTPLEVANVDQEQFKAKEGILTFGKVPAILQSIASEYQGKRISSLVWNGSIGAILESNGSLRPFDGQQLSLGLKQVLIHGNAFVGLSRGGLVRVDPKAQLGWFTSIGVSKIPLGLHWNEVISQIDAQDDALVGVTSQGRVFTLKDSSKQEWLNLPPIASISCGSHHTLFCAKDGRVFGMGSNKQGQLGVPTNSTNSDEPVEIDTVWNSKSCSKPSDSNCVSVAADKDTSYFVIDSTDSTSVVSTGMGTLGQLGNGSFSNMAFTPVTVSALSNLRQYSDDLQRVVPIRISKVTCSNGTCAAYLQSGTSIVDVMAWGSNEHSLLRRLDRKKSNSPTPNWMESLHSPGRLALHHHQTLQFFDGFGVVYSN